MGGGGSGAECGLSIQSGRSHLLCFMISGYSAFMLVPMAGLIRYICTSSVSGKGTNTHRYMHRPVEPLYNAPVSRMYVVMSLVF